MDGMLEATTGALFMLALFLVVPGLLAAAYEEFRRPRRSRLR